MAAYYVSTLPAHCIMCIVDSDCTGATYLVLLDCFLADRTYVTVELMVQVVICSSSSVPDVLWLNGKS